MYGAVVGIGLAGALVPKFRKVTVGSIAVVIEGMPRSEPHTL
jgi:hypothetical protein